jgi:hypothetical protein
MASLRLVIFVSDNCKQSQASSARHQLGLVVDAILRSFAIGSGELTKVLNLYIISKVVNNKNRFCKI